MGNMSVIKGVPNAGQTKTGPNQPQYLSCR